MKIIAAAIMLCILAIIPAVIAEELAGDEPKVEKKVAPPMRKAPDFKSMTRVVSVQPSAKKILTRTNFREITQGIMECRKSCITEFRTCLRGCTRTSSACPKTCKNTNNACYDKCSEGFRRR